MTQYNQVSGNWTSGGVHSEEAAPQRAVGLALAAVAGLALFFWWRQRQPQTFRHRMLERGSDTLEAASKLLPIGRQNGMILRGMETLSAATDLLPGQKCSRWSRITASLLK